MIVQVSVSLELITTSSELTTVPHRPQLLLSVLVSLQVPEQSRSLALVLRGPQV
jgi:hypothetical protein